MCSDLRQKDKTTQVLQWRPNFSSVLFESWRTLARKELSYYKCASPWNVVYANFADQKNNPPCCPGKQLGSDRKETSFLRVFLTVVMFSRDCWCGRWLFLVDTRENCISSFRNLFRPTRWTPVVDVVINYTLLSSRLYFCSASSSLTIIAHHCACAAEETSPKNIPLRVVHARLKSTNKSWWCNVNLFYYPRLLRILLLAIEKDTLMKSKGKLSPKLFPKIFASFIYFYFCLFILRLLSRNVFVWYY